MSSIVTELYGLKVKEISQLDGFCDKNFKIVTEKSNNDNSATFGTFVLKIVNVQDSKTQHVGKLGFLHSTKAQFLPISFLGH